VTPKPQLADQRAALCGEFITPILDPETPQRLSVAHCRDCRDRIEPEGAHGEDHRAQHCAEGADNLTNGLQSAIDAGRVAQRNIIRSEEIEGLGKEQRRIFELVGGR
jgi:hypothetical protein